MTLRLRILAAPAAALAALALAGPAAADTFCVNDGTCPGDHQYGTIQAAFTAANGNGANTKDIVRLGAGVYSETAVAGASNPITLVGAGRTATTIRGTGAASEILLHMDSPDSVVSSVGFLARANDVTGLFVRGGEARAVLSTYSNASLTGINGLEILDGGTLLSAISRVPADSGTAVRVGGTSKVTVSDVEASGARSVDASGDASIARVSTSGLYGITVSDGDVTIDDALVLTNGDGIGAESTANGPAAAPKLTLRNATLVGTGGATIGLSANTTTSGNAAMHLRSSTVTGYGQSAQRYTTSSGTATFDATYSNLDPATTFPAGMAAGTGNVNVVPGFVDAAAGNYQLRADSPLLDAGDPAALASGEPTTDLAVHPRVVEGDGVVPARRDIGALEFQGTAPSTTATASPATALVGQAVDFSGSATDPDAGDALTYSWLCDDGEQGQGTALQHSFTTPGSHACTLTARDRAGKTGSQAATVVVSAPANPGPGGGGVPALDLGLSFAGSPKTVTASSKGTFSWSFTANAGVSGTTAFASANKVAARAARAKKKKTLTLGTKTFTAPANKKVKVTVKLSKSKLGSLKRLKKVKVRARVTVGAVVKSTTFTLKAPKKKRRK
jgi:hypothetical protein